MSREAKQAFYNSPAWKQTRRAYAASVGGLCERCLRSGRYVPGVIVHHIKHITADNLSDPTIVLDWSNLELVCRDCHKALHIRDGVPRRYVVDKTGRVSGV